MPLHVCIASEDEDKILKAIEMIEPLVDPLHPDHEAEKVRGLEQLAIITGTTASFQERQLRLLESDSIDEFSYTKFEVKCSLCGDRGHVSGDCPTARKGETVADWRVDTEYNKLISEIGHKPANGAAHSAAQPPPARAPTSNHPLAMQSIPASAPPRNPHMQSLTTHHPPLVAAKKAVPKFIPPIGFPPGFPQ